MKNVLIVAGLFLLISILPPRTVAASNASVDVYTQRGGIGASEPSGIFMVGELVSLFAKVEYNDFPVPDKIVSFSVHGPSNSYGNFTIILSDITNSSGVASACFRIGPMGMEHWEEIFLGTWLVVAAVEVSGNMLNDSLTFECDWDIAVDLFTQRGGEGFFMQSSPFKAGEIVTLHMKVTNRTVSVPNVFAEYKVYEDPLNYSHYTCYTAFTNEDGIATVSFRLPWKIETNYSIYCLAEAKIAEYLVLDETLFDCLAGERLVGDINYDGNIDIMDVATIAQAFGAYPGHPRWNYECDLNADNHVDITDVSTVAANFGKTLL